MFHAVVDNFVFHENYRLLRFSLSRLLIALSIATFIIARGCHNGPLATVGASISALGVFLFSMLVRLRNLHFLVTVMPPMWYFFWLGFEICSIHQSRYHLVYNSLCGAIIGVLIGKMVYVYSFEFAFFNRVSNALKQLEPEYPIDISDTSSIRHPEKTGSQLQECSNHIAKP